MRLMNNEEKVLTQEEANKLRTRVQLAEDSNKILVKEKKAKDLEIEKYAKLHHKESYKLSEIYRVANSGKINVDNYTNFIDWIKKYIKEDQ